MKKRLVVQCNIADVRSDQILEFLDDLPDISGRTWFNYARLIRTLFNYAQAKRYVPPNIDPMEGIEIDFHDDGEIEIFTPEELRRFLTAAVLKSFPSSPLPLSLVSATEAPR